MKTPLAAARQCFWTKVCGFTAMVFSFWWLQLQYQEGIFKEF
jgi:hypothetical protein